MSSSVASNAVRGASLAVHRSIVSFRSLRKTLPNNLSIAFVPTMGALHEGHLSLIKKARSNNELVIASIFVNPTQFGEGEDLDKYPRQLERDCELLNEMGVDHLFAPDAMYGKHHVTYVDPQGFDNIAEGRARPGHFRGVATIVTKLLNIVQPTVAYFGQKDAAQCVLIQRIVQDLNMDVEIKVLPTIREADGLAMSSRNAYLTPAERAAAPIVFKSLCAARDLYLKEDRSVSSQHVRQAVEQVLKSEALVSQIQYVSVDSRATMQPLDAVTREGAVLSLACKIGNVRLIDNMILE